MTTVIISLLIALNLLLNPTDWDELNPQEQEHLTEIVTSDIMEG